LIYVASPYSHPEEHIRSLRFMQVLRYTNTLLARGKPAFSPIVYGHNFARYVGASTSHNAWLEFNHHMMELSRELHVVMLKGWDNSEGVTEELAYAKTLSLPVTYISWD
jgi:hypothetical protein